VSPHCLRSRAKSDATGIDRRLKEIGQDMDPMTTQKDLALFLKKPENAQKLNGLVQDIRYAVMDYQVCSLKDLLWS